MTADNDSEETIANDQTKGWSWQVKEIIILWSVTGCNIFIIFFLFLTRQPVKDQEKERHEGNNREWLIIQVGTRLTFSFIVVPVSRL